MVPNMKVHMDGSVTKSIDGVLRGHLAITFQVDMHSGFRAGLCGLVLELLVPLMSRLRFDISALKFFLLGGLVSLKKYVVIL